MTLADAEIEELAAVLAEAYETKEPVEPLSEQTEFDTDDAYAIQAAVVDRIRERDEPRLGWKLGLVSEAKQEQLGIPEPIFCPVIPETRFDEAVVPTEAMIAPRVEAEIGLVLGEALEPPVTPDEVLRSTQGVLPVVEILESRYQDWAIPSAQDVIADLTSAGGVIVGESLRDVRDVDLRLESVVVSVNGEVADTGVGADIMGHPARAVAWLANRLADLDETLAAGDLVMTGGIPAAIDAEPGDVYQVEFASIGSIALRAE